MNKVNNVTIEVCRNRAGKDVLCINGYAVWGEPCGGVSVARTFVIDGATLDRAIQRDTLLEEHAAMLSVLRRIGVKFDCWEYDESIPVTEHGITGSTVKSRDADVVARLLKGPQ